MGNDWQGGIIVYTYQMVAISDENGRTYTSKYGTYNKEEGFVLKSYGSPHNDVEDLIYELFHEDCWSLLDTKKAVQKENKQETRRNYNKCKEYDFFKEFFPWF